MTLTIGEVLTIIAITSSPLVAIQVQVWLEKYRVYARRQHEVFRMLMATRQSQLNANHIDALNRIDVDFYGISILRLRWQYKTERDVIAAWREYHTHLHSDAPDESDGRFAFNQRRSDLFVSLLRAIAVACGYDFDKTLLEKMSYTPKNA